MDLENAVRTVFEYGGAPMAVIIAVGVFIWKMSPVIEKYLEKHITGLAKLGGSIDGLSTKVDKLVESDERQEGRLKALEIETAKKNLYSNDLPYSERVWAAHRYLRFGGNGKTKKHIITMLRLENEAEFNAVWKLADAATEAVAL